MAEFWNYMMRAPTVWLGPMLLLLAGCAAVSPIGAPKDPNAPMIGPGQRLNLPRPGELGRSILATQLITARAYGQTFVMEVNISVTPERAMLVGLDPMGRRAMTLTWNDQNVSAEIAPWVPDSLRPGSMLADIIVIYWPESVVRKALPAGGEVLQEARGRTIRIGGQDVLRVDHSWAAGERWNGTLRYSNLAWGYEIDVQSSEMRR
jgi:hypothetical protein